VPVECLRHAPRCKWCSHPQLGAANAIFERVSTRQLSREAAVAELEALGFENPLAGDGWKKHWSSKGHYFYQTPVDAEKAAERAEAEKEIELALRQEASSLLTDILGDDWREKGVSPTPEQILEVQRVLYVHELELRLAAGLPSGITHDQVLKGIGEATKRKQNEAQDQLLKAVAGGVGMVFEKALGGVAEQHELPAAVVILDEEDVE
jgi:hypothetical protein